ncbi:hypothetical protein [Streptomyces huasconensis]|uniref:hypothetical protein n=1 Tax=Streptomyces huasconensis TaxID=1854574 RepID=UPI0036FD7A7F
MDEAVLVHQNGAWVRATLDWIEQAWTPARSTRTQDTPACCGASSRAPGPHGAGEKRPDGTPTPSGSCSSRRGPPASWSGPAPSPLLRPDQGWLPCGSRSQKRDGHP